MIKIGDISSELRMKLEQIRMFLSQGKASVMVGAGFSKNAQQTEFAKMKDWNELTMSFYNQLFIDDEERERNRGLLHEPLKLAQMYECSFGRNALDALIQSSLPNEAAAPGKMHEKLMQLKWCDVFTTNYDTLLEQAAVKVGKIYHEVTNKETLLYAERPRIIKLHGSFPNIRPYIITEEDFRTYPQKYPEFVNTVRQALMESLFCLIGFSGNDPNFLQWIGWLRDVMGNQMSPVYLITYEPNLHKAQIDLFKRRGIEIVNISSLGKHVSFGEGLEYVLDYISQEPKEEWKLNFEEKNIHTVEDILEATEKMRIIRETCPPYLYLPEAYNSAKNAFIPFRYEPENNVISELSFSQKIQFIREIVWRYEIAMIPIVTPWIYELMTDISLGGYEAAHDDQSGLVDIQLALLRMYRESGDDDEQFNKLVILIRDHELQSYQQHRLNYELCLQSLSLLDYDKVRQILSQWDVDGAEIKYALWKSLVLSEIGEDGDAVRLLTSANQWFRQSLLTQRSNQYVAETYSNALDEVIDLHNRKNSPDTPLIKLKEDLIHAIEDAERKSPDLYESKHNFGIDSTQNMWHSGTNLKDRLFPAYRYIRLLETVGYPLGHTQFTIEEAWLEKAVTPIMSFRPAHALRILVRSRSKKATIGCFTREALRKLPVEWADAQYEIYKGKIDSFLKTPLITAIDKKIEDAVIPAFVRLCTRLNVEHADYFAEQYMDYYNRDFYQYDSSQLEIISENLFRKSRARLNYRMFKAKREELHHHLPWSDQWINATPVFEKDVNAMISTLGQVFSPSDRTLVRLWYMLSADMRPQHRNKLESAVRKWRNHEHKSNMIMHILDTFRKVKYKEGEDKKSEKEYLSEVVDSIVSADVENISSTADLMTMRTNFNIIEYFTKELTNEQHELIIAKFIELLTNNEERFKEDDSAVFLGGFRNDVQQLVVYFTRYFAYLDLQEIDASLLKKLMDVCLRYNEYHVAMIAIITKVNNSIHRFASSTMHEKINAALLKGTYYEYAEGLQAIRLLDDEEARNKLINSLIFYVEYCQDKKAQPFLYTLMSLICDNVMKKSEWQPKISEVLNRIADVVVDFNGQEEGRMDIMYYANMLAGVVNVRWGDIRGVERWKNITLDRANFNDVRAGFDIGQSMAYGEEKVPVKNLILNE